jgi:hypothetical protein
MKYAEKSLSFSDEILVLSHWYNDKTFFSFFFYVEYLCLEKHSKSKPLDTMSKLFFLIVLLAIFLPAESFLNGIRRT